MAVTVENLVTEGVTGGLKDASIGRKLSAATDLVERYAPDAPEGVKDEATIRAVGWLLQREPATSQQRVGDVEERFAVGAVNVLYHSGASGLLAPWRVHGLGKVE